MATFTRPADTTAYASGDLVANSVTAGSVVPMQLSVASEAGGGFLIRRARIGFSGTVVTNASFRLHLYNASPTPANGDNAAFSTDKAANYLGAIDVVADRAFTDGAVGFGVPNAGSEIVATPGPTGIIYGLLEARAAFTPTSAEVFTVTLENLEA